MKPLIFLYCSLALLLVSCGSGNKVASSFGFGKRKYTKGYYSFLHFRKINTIAAIPAVKPEHDTRTVAVTKVDSKEPILGVMNTQPKPMEILYRSVVKSIVPPLHTVFTTQPGNKDKEKYHKFTYYYPIEHFQGLGLVGFLLTVAGIVFFVASYSQKGLLIIGVVLLVLGGAAAIFSVVKNNDTRNWAFLALILDIALLLLLVY